MLILICTDGVVRVGDGGGVTCYETIHDFAGGQAPEARLDVTVEQVMRTLGSIGKPRWERMLDRGRRHPE